MTSSGAWIASAAFTLAAQVTAATPAQPDDHPTADQDARIGALEQEVKDLKASVKALEKAQASTEGTVKTSTSASLILSGYVETFYQWNFNNPQNFITNYRGFDNRHNLFSIDNVVIDALGKLDRVSVHFALQVGNTPEAYYAAEPIWPRTGGAGPSGPDVWKFIQQANVAYLAPMGRGLTLDAGVFLSPIGPESIPVKDQWNWSRSNLFFALPYYHTGARATYPITDRLSASLQVYNGWNSVVDNNIQISLAGQVTYNIQDKFSFSALYFGGVERPTNAPEGAPWRHLFDTWVQWSPNKWLQTMLHADGGFEPNNFGTSAWAASAVYLRLRPLPWLYLAGRADVFYEWVASNELGTATPLFWAGSRWVASQTATVDVRPNDNMSVRLEFRRDQSQLPLYFQGNVATDAAGNFITNAVAQTTITLGATAWF